MDNWLKYLAKGYGFVGVIGESKEEMVKTDSNKLMAEIVTAKMY